MDGLYFKRLKQNFRSDIADLYREVCIEVVPPEVEYTILKYVVWQIFEE